jgi:hypothetical protein
MSRPDEFAFHKLGDPPPKRHNAEAELFILRHLECRVREMFEFTGWEDDVDNDARDAVLAVQTALRDLESVRRVFGLAPHEPGGST